MTTVTLKMYLQSRVRAQNERLFNLYQTYIVCKGVKNAKNSPKLSNFEIFADFGGPKWPKGRQILQKTVNDYKITWSELLFWP